MTYYFIMHYSVASGATLLADREASANITRKD
jgi:hypothetical protein